MLIPALKEAKESKAVNHELLRLKHNPLIFDALLAKQKKIETSTEGLGITLGNPDAKYKLIKVCNPYCGPCASAHVVIDELLENNSDIQLQIIFTGNGEDSDFRTAPIRHLLAITEQGDSHLNKQALNDWYLAEKKDYEVFAAIYPINGDLKLQTPKVKLMYEWCEKEKIQFTPTLFVNGYQLPEQYSIANLRYFLSV